MLTSKIVGKSAVVASSGSSAGKPGLKPGSPEIKLDSSLLETAPLELVSGEKPTCLVPEALFSSPWEGVLVEDEKTGRVLTVSAPTSMFRKYKTTKAGVFRTRLATTVSMSSSGAGLINSVINTSLCALLPQWSGFSALFEEFFVVSMRATWSPSSMGTVITGGTSGTNQQSVGLIAVALQHASGAYTTAALAADGVGSAIRSSGLPFSHTWRNVESSGSTVMVNPSSLGYATQSWCSTAATPAAAYTGLIQFISQSSNPLPNSANLGIFLVEFDLMFRQRR